MASLFLKARCASYTHNGSRSHRDLLPMVAHPRSACGGIYAVALLLCTSLFPAGRALANKEGLSLQHPALTGICSRWSHIPLRLRRGYANKKVKGPSEQAQGPFTFSFAVRAGFEPAVRLPVRQFSKLVVSATHPSHQADPFFQWDCKDINKFGYSPKKMRGPCKITPTSHCNIESELLLCNIFAHLGICLHVLHAVVIHDAEIS